MTRNLQLRRFLSSIASLYSPRYPEVLVEHLHERRWSGAQFLGWYWQTTRFVRSNQAEPAARALKDVMLRIVLMSGMLLQILVGILLMVSAVRDQQMGLAEIGLALIISYPLVWAHVLGIGALIANLLNIKRTGLLLLCVILEHQVKALRRRHQFTVVAVAGSVGKTSTKLAIAELLAHEKRVVFQKGNYNTRLTVPLVLFGQPRPTSLYNVPQWLKIISSNQRHIRKGYPYDVAVVELGTDEPGQIIEFSYLKPEIGVVTAVAAEHMEFFGTLDAVAAEELSLAGFAQRMLVNADDVAAKYRKALKDAELYSIGGEGDYRATYAAEHDLEGEDATFEVHGKSHKAFIHYHGAQGVKVVLAAVAVADMMGLDVLQAVKNAEKLMPFAGRMQTLAGKRGSMLIDDTYNASPIAVEAALDVLYRTKAQKRIAILGSMNELGATSQAAHEEVGAYCDPEKLYAVVTIGEEAKRYLAPAALARGCVVEMFSSPYEAGAWVEKQLGPDVVVLAKGSQNGVFAEEALKALLAHPDDQAKLVRQTDHWPAEKRRQFPA